MSPLGIEILLHYHYSAVDYGVNRLDCSKAFDDLGEAQSELINDFIDNAMLMPKTDEDPDKALQLTDRGKFYVNALIATPLPTHKWIIEYETE